jgi:hypothetical protein
MSPVYSLPGHVTVWHNPLGDHILFDWTNLVVPLDEIRAVHERALAAARRHNCRNYLVDQSRVAAALPAAAMAWWDVEWLPVLAEFGLRAVVTVSPDAAGIGERRLVNGIVLIETDSRRAAESVLATV